MYSLLLIYKVNHLLFKEKSKYSPKVWSPLNLAEDDLSLGNLKFILKGEINEVFRMKIPKELITNNIRNAPYYNAYLEMVEKHDLKIAAEKGSKKKSASKAVQSKKPEIAKQSKPVTAYGQAPVGGVAIRKPVAEATQQLPVTNGKGKAITTDELASQSLLDLHKPKRSTTTDQYVLHRRIPVTEEASTGPSTQLQDDISKKIFQDTLSPLDSTNVPRKIADSKRTNNGSGTEVLKIHEERGEEVSQTVVLEEKTNELNEGQAGSNPCKTPES
nr:histone deacetylase 14 [Tanacetum cinerariifolium]